MQTKKIYYIGIQQDNQKKEHIWELLFPGKEEAAACRKEDRLLFPGGCVELCTSLIFFPDNEKMRKRQERRLAEILKKTIQEAGRYFAYEEVLLAEKLCRRIGKRAEPVPQELYAVFLRQQQIVNKITLSLGEEAGCFQAEQAIELLKPYLSRLNQVVFLGKEGAASEWLEDYLYEEYGILTSYAKKPEKSGGWLDLSDQTDSLLEKYASEHGIWHIYRGGILKFLDTTAKNRYNTGVN